MIHELVHKNSNYVCHGMFKVNLCVVDSGDKGLCQPECKLLNLASDVLAVTWQYKESLSGLG